MGNCMGGAVKSFKNVMESLGVLGCAHRFLLCVSGGPDSMAMLHMMATEFPMEDFGVAHLNHGLRKEAERESDMVRSFCAQEGIPFYRKQADVSRYAAQNKIGIEEAGRKLRYEFFRSLGYEYIMTAHHKNDQAETVLGNLIRGCGLHGARGMLPLEGDLLRPLLDVSKETLETYCRDYGIPFVEDASNHELCYRRNVIRHRILPSLAEINPEVVDALCRFAQSGGEEDALIESMAENAFRNCVSQDGDEYSLSCQWVTDSPKALARRVLRKCGEALGGALDFATTERIFFLGEGKQIPLGQRCFCRCSGRKFIFYREHHQRFSAEIMKPVPVNLYGKTTFPSGYMTATPYSGQKNLPLYGFSALFPKRLLEQGVVLRSRQQGDWFHLPHGGRKKLSDYMIDEKIPAEQRDGVLLLAVGHRILWIIGRRICEIPQDDNIFFKVFLKK